MNDLRSIFKEMVGEVLENGLEAELDDELGCSKYDYRNKTLKTVVTVTAASLLKPVRALLK